jgi:alpha-galactosidase
MQPIQLGAALLVVCASAFGAISTDACYASFDNGELKIGNTRIERRWRLNQGRLYATSFRDLSTGTEWLGGVSDQPAPTVLATPVSGAPAPVFSSRKERSNPVEQESLMAELAFAGSAPVLYRFRIFPDAAGVSIQVVHASAAQAPPGAAETAPQTNGIETKPAAGSKLLANVLDAFVLAPRHLRVTQVNLLDQSDLNNELVYEREWLAQPWEKIHVPGNLFVVENTLTHAGLIFLKEAPLPHARAIASKADFDIDPETRHVALLGTAYPGVTLAYSGGRAGRIQALQQYQRQMRVYDPRRDAMFLSNTWGDRSADARISAAFIASEVDAGARLGVDVIQIDAGWEHGGAPDPSGSDSEWNGYWTGNSDYWAVNSKRFPEGLEPLIARTHAAGMRFGLWFAPDWSHDSIHWDRDATRLLELWRQQGVRYFKIDGMKAPTPACEQRLSALTERVLKESNGEVTLDLDITAGTRPGYFGSLHNGPLFLENRYTDWHRYWPHQTLRNLWKLAQYVDPLRLRVEFLNNARNQELYPNDPLAPARYSPAYLFATTMFSNPLGWFEISNLPSSYFTELPPLVAKWKHEREGIFRGTILPIGEAPDGTAWTGFASVAADRHSAYVLVFRELNDAPEWQVAVPLLESGTYHATVLAGAGTAEAAGGAVRVRIPQTQSFLWLRLTR